MPYPRSIQLRSLSMLSMFVLAGLCLLTYQAHAQFVWNTPVSTVIPTGYAPTVLFDEEEQLYKMWYAVNQNGYWDICYAVSFDGIQWLQYPGGAVLSHGAPGSFDSQWVIDPFVMRDMGRYVLYYTGHDGSKWQTGMAWSVDGVHWAKYSGNPVLPVGQGWDNTSSGPRVVLKLADSTYLMVYNGFDGQTYQIGEAISPDGVVWTKKPGPKFGPGPAGTWDAAGVTICSIILEQGTYYMFYQAATYETPLGLATSKDGLTWTRIGSKPILTGAMTGWAPRLGFGSALVQDSTLRYWLSGDNGYWSIGLITAPWPDSAAFSDTASSKTTGLGMLSNPPAEFKLDAAYPNPFNPSTTFSYVLPKEGPVKITIYNSIGQEVATVVNDTQTAGEHRARWDASEFASGAYLCRLEAAGHVQTERVILVK